MAGCPTVRFTKLKTTAAISSLAGHHLRTIPVKNADPERTPENQLLMGLDVASKISKRVMAMTLPLKKRDDNVRCIEVLMGASNDFWDAGGDWVELAKAHKKMLISEFGEQNIVAMGWHLDEGKPHGWAFVAPITPDGRLAASHWTDGPTKLKKLLTRVQPFYNHLEMKRGREGFRARHIEMREIHAANAGNKRAQKQIDNEMALRAKNALAFTKRTELKAVQVQAELELLEVKKSKANQVISEAKVWLEDAKISIEKRENALKQDVSENEKLRGFLNVVAKELKAVFNALPESVFLSLPEKLQASLIKFFKLTPIAAPVKPISSPTHQGVPNKAATGLLNTLARPFGKSTPKPK